MAYTVDTAYNVYTIQTTLHCLNSMPILLGKVRTLLEWADAHLSKKWERCWMGNGVDTT